MINAGARDRTSIDGRRGRNSLGENRDDIASKRRHIQGEGRQSLGGGRDGMEPSLTNAIGDDSNGSVKSEVIRPMAGQSAELSTRAASGGGDGEGEWSVHTVDMGGDKRDNRDSLPKLDGRGGAAGGAREGGNEDADGDGNSVSGEPEEGRASSKRSRSARQRKNTRTLRRGGGEGGSGVEEEAGLSSPVSSTKGRKSSRRGQVGVGDGGTERKGRARSRVAGQEEANREEMPAHEELLESGRGKLSPSSVSSSISVAASGPRSAAKNDDRIEVEPTVDAARGDKGGVESRDDSSSAEGRRARPPRLDL